METVLLVATFSSANAPEIPVSETFSASPATTPESVSAPVFNVEVVVAS